MCKLEKLWTLLERACSAKKLTLRELQSLIGSLSFVCKAVPPGRAFLRRIINLTVKLKHPGHLTRVTREAREDLRMWKSFLDTCNGAAIIPERVWLENTDIQLYTDASGSIGFGGYFRGSWFQGHWPEHVLASSPSIAWLEFFPIVVAVTIWGESLSGKRVLFRSDNQSVVAIINKQSSQCPLIMRLVRYFVLQCLRWNVMFRSVHIPGVQNDISDALSRFQVSRFRALAPEAKEVGEVVPQVLWRI